MASGGSSIYKGSDLIHDYSCSKCEEDDLNTEAQHFCPQCEHYLCDKCVAMHNGYHKNHTVCGRREIQKWSGFSLDKCDQHGDKLNVHCDDHKELCCSVCVALNHRLCSSISHLPDLARGFLKTKEFKQLPAAVNKMRSMLNELRYARIEDQASLKDSYKNIIAEIKDLRKGMNKILDELEKNTVEQLDSLMKDLDQSLKDNLDTCAHMNDQLKTMVDKLQHMTGKHTEINSYIGFIKCQSMLSKTNSMVKQMQKRPKEGMKFKSDESVTPFLRNLSSLGDVEIEHSMSKTTDTVHVYKTQSQSRFSVKIKKDVNNCHITGICVLPSGEVVICDFENSKVKLLNQQYEVIDHYDLPSRPNSMCYTSGNEVAVVVNYNALHEVRFLTMTRGQLHADRKFTTDFVIKSIAHHQGQLYVCTQNILYQYTMYGQMKNKIYDGKSERSTLYNSAVSPDGERIYVTKSRDNELVTMDKVGQVLYTFEDPELQKPTGQCVSPRGYVFVCGFDSCTVLQVDQEGRQKLATVVTGTVYPESVWFSEATSSLIIGGRDNNIIVVKLC